MAEARRRAYEQFGVELRHEVEFLGDLELPPRDVGAARPAANTAGWQASVSVRRASRRARAPRLRPSLPRRRRSGARALRAVGTLAPRRPRSRRARGRRLRRRARDRRSSRSTGSRSSASRARFGRRCGGPSCRSAARACSASTAPRSCGASRRCRPSARRATTVRSRTRCGSRVVPETPGRRPPPRHRDLARLGARESDRAHPERDERRPCAHLGQACDARVGGRDPRGPTRAGRQRGRSPSRRGSPPGSRPPSLAHDALVFRLRSGLELRLGAPTDVRLKLAIARRALRALPAGATYVDVSVPGRPVAGTDPQLSGRG